MPVHAGSANLSVSDAAGDDAGGDADARADARAGANFTGLLFGCIEADSSFIIS